MLSVLNKPSGGRECQTGGDGDIKGYAKEKLTQ
jgi:hypothetical protein